MIGEIIFGSLVCYFIFMLGYIIGRNFEHKKITGHSL